MLVCVVTRDQKETASRRQDIHLSAEFSFSAQNMRVADPGWLSVNTWWLLRLS